MVAASTGAQSVKLADGGDAMLVFNASNSVAFVRFGTDASVTAGGADLPVPPGSRTLMHVGGLAGWASAVLLEGAGNVYFTRGEGSTY
jgi:hypothetical protein